MHLRGNKGKCERWEKWVREPTRETERGGFRKRQKIKKRWIRVEIGKTEWVEILWKNWMSGDSGKTEWKDTVEKLNARIEVKNHIKFLTWASNILPVLHGLLGSHNTKPGATSASSTPLSFTFTFSPQLTVPVSSSSRQSMSTVTGVYNDVTTSLQITGRFEMICNYAK